MITLSEGILQAQKLSSTSVRRIVAYRRRYWDIGSQEFVHEPDWTVINEKAIRELGKTKEELDAVKLNEFRTGSLSIRLCNGANEWLERADYGVFLRDDNARLGYTAYRTMFKVSAVYQYADGTESEEVVLFTGYVSGMTSYAEDKTVQVSLDAPHILLDDADAENYSTAVTGEILGTGDGTTTEFLTAEKNVGGIRRVTVGGVLKLPGIDYDIADTDTYDTQAKITFKSAPSTGEAVACDYFCWHTSLPIHQAVSGLLDSMGFPADERDISEVLFPNRVYRKAAYTHTEDNVRYEADELPTKADPEWEEYENTGSYEAEISADWPADIGGGSNALKIYASNTDASSLCWRRAVGAAGNAVMAAFSAVSEYANQSVYLGIAHEADGANKAQILIGTDVGGSGISCMVKLGEITLWSGMAAPNTQYILYHKPGRVVAFVGGARVVNYTYTAGTAVDPIIDFGAVTSGNTGSEPVYIGYVRHCGDYGDLPADPVLPLVGTKVYPTLDFSADIVAFGRQEETVSNWDGTASGYRTRTSADGSAWSAFAAIGSGGQINSPAARYGQVEITRTSSDNGQSFPAVTVHALTYYTSRASLKMCVCSDMTVLDAIAKLAELASYEYGFTRTGRFFFRPRGTGTTPDITLSNRDIREISSIKDGIDAVYNKIKASYGEYSVTVLPDTLNLPEPNSCTRYGVRSLSISGGFLLEDDADLATGAALQYFALCSRPRREMELSCRFMPQIEAGDIVRVNVTDTYPAHAVWHIGDTAAHLGQSDIGLWGDSQQTAFGFTGRVVEAAHDAGKMQTQLTLRETVYGN